MTSRERYRLAMNLQEPDRVPIDFGQDGCNGINEIAYTNLIKYLDIIDEVKIFDFMQRLAIVKEEILTKFNVDTRYIFANKPKTFNLTIAPDGSYTDEFGVIRKRVGFYCENIYPPLGNASLQEIVNWKMPDPEEKSRFENLKERTKKLCEETHYALIAGDLASIFYLPAEIIGYQKFMESISMNLSVLKILIDRIMEWHMAFLNRYLDEIGNFIETVWIADDWGTQNGPIMNPNIFKEIFKPRYVKLIDFIKSKTKAKICLHSCGSIFYAIPDFIDMGVDAIQPLQAAAAEMDNPIRLKDKFGDKIAFYSNMPNQTVVPNGTPAEVREEVKKRIKYLAPGGGYIFAMGHNIQADVPPENIVTGFKAAYEFGKYPINL
ncbi:MAG: hypothetical protein HQ569_00150 [Actinobacteria bacterium]|nr:hypothetical protein [Actinomycetota bacterium]